MAEAQASSRFGWCKLRNPWNRCTVWFRDVTGTAGKRATRVSKLRDASARNT